MFFEQVFCINYLHRFRKDTIDVKTLIDLGSEVNTKTPAYISKLGLKVHYTNIEAQKIDSSTLKTFRIVFASVQVEDKLGKARFFQKTLLLANINIEVVLNMLFLIFGNANI